MILLRFMMLLLTQYFSFWVARFVFIDYQYFIFILLTSSDPLANHLRPFVVHTLFLSSWIWLYKKSFISALNF